jgi:hypothetical protein
MVEDMFNVINNQEYRSIILKGIKKTESDKLWTWDERLSTEIKEVEKLFD